MSLALSSLIIFAAMLPDASADVMARSVALHDTVLNAIERKLSPALPACASPRESIFGRDDRVVHDGPVRRGSYQARVGYLSSGCAASLIGRDLILTNRHCIPLDQSSPLIFDAGRNGDTRTGSGRVTQVWYPDVRTGVDPNGLPLAHAPSVNDWAIAKLDKPLGQELGFFEIAPVGNLRRVSGKDLPVRMPGYSLDLGRHNQSEARDCMLTTYVSAHGVLHDCDSGAGSSGAPLLHFGNGESNPKLVALNYMQQVTGNIPEGGVQRYEEYNEIYANGAVDASRFADAVQLLRQGREPAGLKSETR